VGGGSHFSHIVGNRSKVAFLILLEVESGRWNFCWVESHVSHIVGSRLEAHDSHIVWSRARTVVNCRRENQFFRNITSPQYNQVFLILLDRILLGAGPLLLGAGGKDTFSNCWEPVGMSGFLTIGSSWGGLLSYTVGSCQAPN
jgi:hypothetical protein